MKKIFGKNTPYADDLDKMTSLMLVNSNPAVDFPESLPQNIIQVGGLQIKEPKTVPHDINQFILKGKKGAVLMALGTNMRSDEIGQDGINAVIEAFRLIPEYNFIWKFETGDMIKDMPSNVMIKDWLPQNDILAHPQVKAFITHGGLLSTHESIWHGVPMVL
jgi:UDP:flavonoid glycosyltransferase YjiC (YdhE family)